MGILNAKCTSKIRLDGKTAVITGCNTGIGKETAKDFFQRGARVIMACRNLESARKAAEDIRKQCENMENCGDLNVVELDLSDLENVRKSAGKLIEENQINILVNNAGVMMAPFTKTKQGYELQFATNHLGHYLLTLLLLPKIIESQPARIVTVSSRLHTGGQINFEDLNFEKRPYSALAAYQQSKLANILFVKELARKLALKKVTNVNCYALHPGVIASDLSRHLAFSGVYDALTRIFAKNVQQGAQTSIYCAVDEKCERESGFYYAECKIKEPSTAAGNMEVAGKLWDVSWELVGFEKTYEPFETKNRDSYDSRL